MLRRIETIGIWVLLSCCCVLVLAVIGASKLYPEGNSENRLVSFLLKHVTIQTVIEDDKWSVEYPYPFSESKIDSYLTSVNKIEKVINSYCTISFPGSERINNLVSVYKDKIMHYHISSISSIEENRNYIAEYADNVVEFKKEVNSLGMPFFYVQTPLKASIDYYDNKVLYDDDLKTAERSYCFTSALEDSKIDVVNIARDYSDEITFDSSSHWKPADGLDCAEIITEKLAYDYGFDIDLAVYEDSQFYDLGSKYPDIKKAIEATFGYEFILPCPNYATNIRLIYAEDSIYEGTFDTVIFKDSDEWSLQGGAYHNVFRIVNSLIHSIHNDNASCNMKVLLIGDSFNWPVGSYLSLACSDVTIIHNASFTGSLISYIKSMEPDIVIMVYNDAEFNEIFTEDAYYLK